MNKKPQQILDLEKELRFKLKPYNEDKGFYEVDNRSSFKTNEKNEVILLQLRNNNLRNIDMLKFFMSIEILDISGNQISDISPLQHLKSLKQLNLFNNLISDIYPLQNLTSLNILNAYHNEIRDIHPLQNLTRLDTLNLLNNQISDILPLQSLINLKELYLSDNQISNISAVKFMRNLVKLGLSDNQINDISPIGYLKNLQELNLSKNKLTDVSSLSDLKKLLNLQLSSNKISDITCMKHLNNLTKLLLYENLISDISPLKDLVKLKILYLFANQISDISPLKDLKELEDLYLGTNPIEGTTISNFNDIDAIRGYFASLEEEKNNMVNNHDVKINILGTGRIGKTQLFRFLQKQQYQQNAPITHGTGVGLYKFTLGDVNYKASLWDFGGQSYQHGTHSLFLRQRDFNIVLHSRTEKYSDEEWQKIQEEEKHLPEGEKSTNPRDVYGYGYWLGAARAFADGKKDGKFEPLFMIQNQWSSKDDAMIFPCSKKTETYQVALNDMFVLDIEEIHQNKNFAWQTRKNYFINSLKEKIIQHAASFGQVPKKFINVKDKVIRKKDGSIFTPKAKFKKEYANELDDNMFAYLLQYLEFTGTILYFRENENLNQFVFNNPKVLSDWIYKTILNEAFLDTAKGVLDFDKLIDKEGKEKATIFLALMNEFNLIFKEKEDVAKPTNNYVIPQFLPENDTSFKKVLLNLIPFTFSIRFEDFIFEGRIFNFLATYGEYAQDKTSYWKYGILFTKDDVQAIVYYDASQRMINVHLGIGKKRLDVAQEIFDFFVLKPLKVDRAIMKQNNQKEFKDIVDGINVEDSIKFDGEGGLNIIRKRDSIIGSQLSTNSVNYIDITETIAIKDNHLLVGKCVEENKNIQLDFLTIKLLRMSRMKQTKIFISYAKENKEQVNQFQKQIAPFKLTREVETWHCSELELGEDWETKIKAKFYEADIILYFISAEFFSTPFIIDEEVKHGIARANDANDEVVLVPIILERIHWEDMMGKFSSNFKGIPINAYENSTDAWYEIVEDLKNQYFRKKDANSTSSILGQAKAKMEAQEKAIQ